MIALLSSLSMDDAQKIVGAFLGLSAIAYACNLLARLIYR